jgi:hypothetical protein
MRGAHWVLFAFFVLIFCLRGFSDLYSVSWVEFKEKLMSLMAGHVTEHSLGPIAAGK